MADFSFLSDTDDSAVEEILAEAMDHCVLKQVAAINCSSFFHSELPSHLESRFQRLKTFPSSSSSTKTKTQLAHDSPTELKNSALRTHSPNNDQKPISGDFGKDPDGEKDCKGKLNSGFVSSPSDSSNSSSGYVNFPKNRGKMCEMKIKDGNFQSVKGCDSGVKKRESDSVKKSCSGYVSSPCDSLNSSSRYVDSPKIMPKSGDKKVKKGKSPSGSFSFGSNSSDSSSETVKSGCFWCSPKKVLRKKSGNKNGVAELGLDWGEHDEILSDLRSVSLKEQKKMMKETMKEAERINKEAEKIVKMAKQASARLNVSISDDDEFSDDDFGHHFGHH